MAIKIKDISSYKDLWPYVCLTSTQPEEMWLWLDTNAWGKYEWWVIQEDDGSLTPFVYIGLKEKDLWARFSLIWS